MTEHADGSKPPTRWRRQPVTVGELIDTLKGYDPDMRVVVDGYEDGYDSLTADSITEVAIVADAAKTDRSEIVGDHQNPEKLSEAGDDTGWGGEWTQPYTADAAATAPLRALLLSRRGKGLARGVGRDV